MTLIKNLRNSDNVTMVLIKKKSLVWKEIDNMTSKNWEQDKNKSSCA